jgi:transcriptional regulator with XRE-family HTH domain
MKSKTQNTTATTLRELIRLRRSELGLSQRALGKSLGVTGELICYVEGGQRHLHLNRIPSLASTLVCDRKELCRLALREFAPVLYAELFAAAVPVEAGSLSKYGEFQAGSGTFVIDPNGSPTDFE